MKYNPIPSLLNASQPWVRYNSCKNLLNNNIGEEDLLKHKKTMLKDHFIKNLIESGVKWENIPLRRHNDAKHPIHHLEILVEFGLTREDPGISQVCEKILSHQSSDGAFLTNILVPKRFKGSGEPTWAWMTCDIPILIYFLSYMGYKTDQRVKKAIDHLTELVRENGFGCHSSIPKFRGPGRKDDHCPYGNLLALKALANHNTLQVKKVWKSALQAQMEFWENRKQRKIYLFGIGTDFKKLKYPNIYYNIIHVLDVLSLYEDTRKTQAFEEMLAIVNRKQREEGGFIPESVWRAYNTYDFGQKKEISPTLTYKIALINHRCGLIPEEWLIIEN
ncbi:MAG: hypothetical protein ACW991_00935 [Candidatus Hodarchaeales archaeon]|jgi:hypothetical protein